MTQTILSALGLDSRFGKAQSPNQQWLRQKRTGLRVIGQGKENLPTYQRL